MIPGKRYTPELILATAWRRKWLILIPTVAIAAIACAYTYFLPDQYRSETTVLVVPQRIPENYIRSTVASRVEDRLRSINQQVRSRTRLEAIIEEFKLYPEQRKTGIMQDIVEAMNDKIDVQIVQEDVFKVAFIGDSPRVAQQVTDKLASFFIDESLKDRANLAEGTTDFLESELDEAGRKLRETEMKLAEYRRKNDGELPTQVDANLQGLNNTRMQLLQLQGDMDRMRDSQLTAQRTIQDLSLAMETAAAASPAEDPKLANTAAARLQVARQDLAALLTKLRPGHPDVTLAEQKITELEAQAAVEAAQTPLGAAGISPSVARLTTQLTNARTDLERVNEALKNASAQQADLIRRSGEFQRRMQVTPIRDAELVELMRDYTTLKSSYESLSAKRIDSEISANLEKAQHGERFRVLDSARLPERPFSPDRPRFYMLGVLLAIGVGLAAAAAAEYLDRGLRSEDDVRLALALPVLATIPVISSSGAAVKKTRRLLTGLTSAIVIAAAVGAAWYMRG